jgi:hypothetical protein
MNGLVKSYLHAHILGDGNRLYLLSLSSFIHLMNKDMRMLCCQYWLIAYQRTLFREQVMKHMFT